MADGGAAEWKQLGAEECEEISGGLAVAGEGAVAVTHCGGMESPAQGLGWKSDVIQYALEKESCGCSADQTGGRGSLGP